MVRVSTADLYDVYENTVQIAEPILRSFGGVHQFYGQIVTVRVYEDNSLVRSLLGEAGMGRVLVVDGGGSLRCSLMGDRVAKLGYDSGWAGVVINGSVRDTVVLSSIQMGMRALNTTPRKSVKRGEGERDVPVAFAGIVFIPGHYLYADEDGIIVAAQELKLNDPDG